MTQYAEILSSLGVTIDGDITTLLSERSALEAANAALIGESAALQAANLALTNEVAVSDANLKASRARVARIRKLLTECRGGEVPKPSVTAWGSSTGAHTYDEFTLIAGSPLKARRSYQTIGQPFPLEDAGRCISVVSVAANPAAWSTSKPRILSYLRSIPMDQDTRFIKSHEPENPKKGYHPAVFAAEQDAIRTECIDVVNDERIEAGGIPIEFWGNFMAWSARAASGMDMSEWMPNEGTWDGLAWDGYAKSGTGLPGAVFDDALAFTRRYGLRFGIAECGITIEHTPEQRVVWIDLCQQYALDAGAGMWMYWDGSFWIAYLNTIEEFKAVVLHP